MDFLRTKPVFKVHFESEAVDPSSRSTKHRVWNLIKVLIPELSRVFVPNFKPSTPADASADSKS